MLKNLATCTPREFLAQTNKLRKLAKEWLNETGTPDIKKVLQNLSDEVIEETGVSATDEERESGATKAVINKLDKWLEKLLDINAEKTLNLLCLCCFVEPKDSDNHQMWEFYECINDMLNNEATISFFMSLLGVAKTTILH